MQIILVESGATKSDWRLLDDDGGAITQKRILKPGMNVSAMSPDAVKQILASGLSDLSVQEARGFYLYTAGVVTPEIREELCATVRSAINVQDIDIQNDLMGAARSVCGRGAGIVAIMGTGSNTCFYDGRDVSQKVMSGGYIIGDDGSAAALGRRFLSDFIKNLIPSDVSAAFEESFDASYAAIVENVYRSDAPSKYLGSLAPFIVSHYDNPYIKNMVDANFRAFIDRSLLQYDTERYPLGVVGGFGYAYRDIFRPLAEESGIVVKSFIREPIEGLIEYHAEK